MKQVSCYNNKDEGFCKETTDLVKSQWIWRSLKIKKRCLLMTEKQRTGEVWTILKHRFEDFLLIWCKFLNFILGMALEQ
jgi:hypothetical protein